MFGGKKTTPAVDVINTVLKSGNYKDRKGAIVLARKNGRKTVDTGVLYVNNNEVYAAEVENTSLSMGTRAYSSGEMKREDFEELKRKFNGALNHPGVLAHLLENHVITDAQAVKFSAEYFITNVETIFSWGSVTGEWQEGREYKYSIIDTSLPLDKINTLITKRKKLYRDFQNFTVRYFKPHDFQNLVFVVKNKVPSGVTNEMLMIYELCQDGITVPQASAHTGLTPHTTFQILLGFWKSGVIDIALNGIELSYETAVRTRKLGIAEEAPDLTGTKTSPDTAGDDANSVPVDDDDVIEGEVVEGPAAYVPEPMTVEDSDRADDSIRFVEPKESTIREAIAVPVAEPVQEAAPMLEIEAEESQEFLPKESPVYLIHQKLEVLYAEKEKADQGLSDIKEERQELEQGIELILDRLEKIKEQLQEERDTLRLVEGEEVRQEKLCEDIDARIEETITSFQYHN